MLNYTIAHIDLNSLMIYTVVVAWASGRCWRYWRYWQIGEPTISKLLDYTTKIIKLEIYKNPTHTHPNKGILRSGWRSGRIFNICNLDINLHRFCNKFHCKFIANTPYCPPSPCSPINPCKNRGFLLFSVRMRYYKIDWCKSFDNKIFETL